MADNFKHTKDYAKRYALQVENEIKTRLVNNGKVSSGKLFDSIRGVVKVEHNDIIVKFQMAEYGKYVDKGVTGAGIPKGFGGRTRKVNRGQFDKNDGRTHAFGKKMPPSKPIKDWMRIQGIPKDAEFPIRRSIWIFGIAPTNFFTLPTTRRQKQFELGLEKAMLKDIEDSLKDL